MIFWPFNQTRMELKHWIDEADWDGNCAFNQTRMELKPGFFTGSGMVEITFNQTRMELKLALRLITGVPGSGF